MTRFCKNTKCQKELINGKRIWCSDDCRKNQYQVLPRVLNCAREECKKEFLAAAANTKFCSVECRKKNLSETSRVVKVKSPLRIMNNTANHFTFAYDFVFSTNRSDWIISPKMKSNRKATKERNEIEV
jgi:chromosome condensin MukBEF ATPase and DNA-binding subunit MukB